MTLVHCLSIELQPHPLLKLHVFFHLFLFPHSSSSVMLFFLFQVSFLQILFCELDMVHPQMNFRF